NILAEVEQADVEAIFEAFGSICMSKRLDPTAEAPGKATLIVEYEDAQIAAATAASMGDFDLAGCTLSCQLVSRTQAVQAIERAGGMRGVLLENMVSMGDLGDPGLKEEIAEEASNYGPLDTIDLVVDEQQQQVRVKLLYSSAAGASTAIKAMHGRTFAGNKIQAKLLP
ncbi:hypothetical protein B484DRAFT_390229, partial [Ochromonadaceae sp. CCMP2298]